MANSSLNNDSYRFYQLDDYLRLPREPQPWVIHSLIPVGGLVNVFGKPKTGKSFIALDMAAKVARGEKTWEGYPIQKPGPVCYFQIDTPREEWARRAEEVKRQANRDGVALWIADMYLVPQFPVNLEDPRSPNILWLKQEMEKINPVMVVIDTLREVHGGDENDSTIMRNVIANIVGCCRPASIVLVSHSRKDQQGWQEMDGEDDMMDQARGSSYVAGRMDVIIKVTKRRMMFKGRATGAVTEQIQQDPETGWISLKREEDGSTQAIEELWRMYPGISQNSMADKLARKMGYSLSTAIRRLREWTQKQDNPQ